MIWAVRNALPLLVGAAVCYVLTAAFYVFVYTPNKVHVAETAARAEVVQGQLEATITELARQRESVRAATVSLQTTLSNLKAQNDAALDGLEQEIASYEQGRDLLAGDCVLSDADAAWLRGH